jgi:hypothetical protein
MVFINIKAAVQAGYESEAVANIDAFRSGGHRIHLGHPDTTLDYEALKERLMLDSELHASMPPMANSIELAERGTRHGLPNGYLSTRPDAIGEATYHSLQTHGFVDAPMLLRAENIPYADTILYKIRPLAVLRATLDAHNLDDRPVVFVDDYAQLVEGVNQGGINLLTGVHFGADTSWSAIARDYLGIKNF